MVATGSPGRVAFVSVRHAGGVRVLTVLEPAIRQEYLALVAPAARPIESWLLDCVVANRVATSRADPPELRLRPWRTERRAFAARMRDLAARGPAIAIADVRRCYASISPPTVARALGALQVPGARAIADFLARLELAGVRGLPVGPEASAVLANAVLSGADRALRSAGFEHLRWVDDLVIALADASEARCALRILADALAGHGLRLNDAKTRIVSTPGTGLGAPSPTQG